MTEPYPVSRPTTPGTIYFAIACFVFALASPVLAELDSRHSPGDGWHAIRVFLPWLLAGGAAALVGIISTAIGAWRSPRSVLTLVVCGVASLFGVFFLFMLSLSSH